jgi:hypothetical protein
LLIPLTGEGLTRLAGCDFKFPCCRAYDDLKSWEVLSEDCHNRLSALALSEVGEDPCGLLSAESASSAAPNFLKQRRKQAAGGVFLFGDFILDKQNKVTRLEAKKNIHTAHRKQVRPTTLSTFVFNNI